MTVIDTIIAKGLGRKLRSLTPKERMQRKAAAQSRARKQQRMDAARRTANRSETSADRRIFEINQRNFANMRIKGGEDALGQVGDTHSIMRQRVNRRRYERRQSRGQ